MTLPWKILVALPVVLFAASAVLNVAYPDCGYAGAPPCESNWVYHWKDYTAIFGFLALGVLAFATALRALTGRFENRFKWWAVLGFAIPWAYGAGWIADAFLNDDMCSSCGYEGDRGVVDAEHLNEKWPVRTNCRGPHPDGSWTFEQGDARVFYSVFAFWIVVAVLIVMRGRWWARALAAATAFVISVGVMFT